MVEQRIQSTDIEAQILSRREQATQQAANALTQAQVLATEAFTLFCRARAIPDGAHLLRIEADHVVVGLPDPPPTPEAPKE